MGDRLQDRLGEIYRIGGGPGANRVGFSAEEDEAHRLTAIWMEELGLEVEVDETGNLIGRLRGEKPELPEVWSGSHLDSVPQGGRFDGPLGVLAALTAVERLGRQPRTLGVVAFRDEERGCAGSRARVAHGQLPGAFLELHHEQGPRLWNAGAPLAVVSGIVGYARGEKVFQGRPGHAGTTPMEARDDALVAAAAEILRIRDVAGSIDQAVATVGTMEVEPGGVNVIPGRVRFTVDARAPDDERLARLVHEIGVEGPVLVPATEFRGAARAALQAAIEARSLPLLELPSGAGHDAGVLARAGVDSGMLFVRAAERQVSATRPTRRATTRMWRLRWTCSERRCYGWLRLPEDDLLSALPEELHAQRAQALVALDDRGEVVPRELTRLRRKVDVAVGEQDLRLGDTARIEHDLARARVAGCVLWPETEVEVAERDPAGFAAPAHVNDPRLEREQAPEGSDRRGRRLLLEACPERESAGRDLEHAGDPSPRPTTRRRPPPRSPRPSRVVANEGIAPRPFRTVSSTRDAEGCAASRFGPTAPVAPASASVWHEPQPAETNTAPPASICAGVAEPPPPPSRSGSRTIASAITATVAATGMAHIVRPPWRRL